MFIGIDLGTSSVKMILVNHEQNILATSDSPLTVQNLKDGYSEQNPQEWINATVECLESLKNQGKSETIKTSEKNVFDEERVPMSRLRRVVAKRLKEAQNTAAMLTTSPNAGTNKLIVIFK